MIKDCCDDRDNIVRMLNKLNHKMIVLKNRELSELGVTSAQMMALLYLVRHEGQAVNQRAIEEFMGLKASSVTGMIRNMMRGGLVERRVNATDARSFDLVLTDKARAVLNRGKEQMLQLEAFVETLISQEEKQMLVDIILRLIGGLEAIQE